MIITAVETFAVAPRWLFLKVSTDEGIVGWGEATLEGRVEVVRAAVHVLEDLYVGTDPLLIEDHWQVAWKSSFYRGGPVLATAVSAYDHALWDIAGKHRNAPVHELLGGPVRDRVRVYSWIGGDVPAEVAERAAATREAGFTAIKMNASGRLTGLDTSASVDRIVALAEAARAAMGPDGDFAMDFHGRFTTPMARRVIHELEPLRPMFVEEPVLPEYGHRLRDVVESTTVPIACGERLFSRSGFLPALQERDCRRPARSGALRRDLRGPADRKPRRDLRRPRCAALPAGSDRAGRVSAGRLHNPKPADPRAEPRYPLQHDG